MKDDIEKIRVDLEKARMKLTDEEKLGCVEIFPIWCAGNTYTVDKYVQHMGLLYKCRQAHTSQTGWEPDVAPALWTEISKEDGSHDHPIHYHNNMELEEGLYYTQYEVLYYCFRGTGQPVFNDLEDLIDIYVEVSN